MKEDYNYKYLKYKSKYDKLLQKSQPCMLHNTPGCGCDGRTEMTGGGEKSCNCNIFTQKNDDNLQNPPPGGCGMIGGASKKKTSKKHKALTIYRYVVGDLVRDIYGNIGIVEELWVDRNPVDPHTEKYFIKFNNGTQAWVHSSGLQKVYEGIDTYQQVGPNTYIPKEKKAVYTPDVYNYISPTGQIITAAQTYDPLYANATNITSAYVPQYSYPTSYVPVARYHDPDEVIIKKSSKKKSKRNYRGGSLHGYENLSAFGSAPPLPPRAPTPPPLPPRAPTSTIPFGTSSLNSYSDPFAPPKTSKPLSTVVNNYYPYLPAYAPVYRDPYYNSIYDPIISLDRRPVSRKSSRKSSRKLSRKTSRKSSRKTSRKSSKRK